MRAQSCSFGRARHAMSRTSSTSPSLAARARRGAQLRFLAAALLVAPWCANCTGDSGPKGPEPTLPARPELLPPELLALIEKYIGEVRTAPADGARHGALGLLYEANELWPEARSSFETARTLQPGDPLWHLHAGIAQAQGGDVPAAIESLRQGAAQHPGFAPLHARLGDLYLLGGQTAEARAAYEAARQLAPQAPEPLLGLAEVALAENAAEQAIDPLERALALDPHYRAAHHLLGLAYGQIGLSAESTRELLAGQGGLKRSMRDAGTLQLPILSFGRTRVRVESGKLLTARRAQEAAEMIEPLVAIYPDDAMLRVNLALAWKELGRTDEALGALAEAEELDPTLALAPLNRAAVLLEQGRAQEAADAAARALAIDARFTVALLVRAQALLKLGQLDEARAAAEQALALDARLAPAHEVLGAVAEAHGMADEARASFLRSAELAASDPRPWPAIFRFALRTSDFELAERALETLRKLDPGYPQLDALSSELEAARAAPR
jgi:tetratricopeptide (TPR) repeat protein